MLNDNIKFNNMKNDMLRSSFQYEAINIKGITSILTGEERQSLWFSPYFDINTNYIGPVPDNPTPPPGKGYSQKYTACCKTAWIQLTGNRKDDYAKADAYGILANAPSTSKPQNYTWHHVYMGYQQHALLAGVVFLIQPKRKMVDLHHRFGAHAPSCIVYDAQDWAPQLQPSLFLLDQLKQFEDLQKQINLLIQPNAIQRKILEYSQQLRPQLLQIQQLNIIPEFQQLFTQQIAIITLLLQRIPQTTANIQIPQDQWGAAKQLVVAAMDVLHQQFVAAVAFYQGQYLQQTIRLILQQQQSVYWIPCDVNITVNGNSITCNGARDTGHLARLQLVPTLLHESTYTHKGSVAQWEKLVGRFYGIAEKYKSGISTESDKPKLKVSSKLSANSKYSLNEVSCFERKLGIKLPRLVKELYRGTDIREFKLKYGLRNTTSRSSYELDDATVETIFPFEREGDTKTELLSQEYLAKGDFMPSVERSYFMHTNEQSRAFLELPVPNAIPFGWDEFGELLYASDDMVFRYEHEFDRFTPFVLS